MGLNRVRPIASQPVASQPVAGHAPAGHAPAGHAGLPALVLAWWEASGLRERRDALPWRSATDPWHVLVSEVMLSQTQAARVAGRYGAFVDRFGSPVAMAAARVGDVLAAWSGLGYNRRALSLHRAAALICERHLGEVPADLESLLALPGVGPYTARAVLTFGFGRPEAPVDTNIGRVLARGVAGTRLGGAEAQALADSLVPVGLERKWSLALMDLGAEHCRSRDPRCGPCPLGASRRCAWRGATRAGTSPAPAGGPDDPAVRSAGVSGRQGRFEGSDRQGRGRLLRAACHGPVSAREIPGAAGWVGESERANRVVSLLVAEGLLCLLPDGSVALP